MDKEKFDALTTDEKLKVCWDIHTFVTLNGISKGDLHHIFKWLVDETMEEKENVNGKDEINHLAD